jgi:hypothetical protein
MNDCIVTENVVLFGHVSNGTAYYADSKKLQHEETSEVVKSYILRR